MKFLDGQKGAFRHYLLSIPSHFAHFMLTYYGAVVDRPGNIYIKISARAFLMGQHLVGSTRIDEPRQMMRLRATPDFNKAPQFDHVLIKKTTNGVDVYLIGQVMVLFSVQSLAPPAAGAMSMLDLYAEEGAPPTAAASAAASAAAREKARTAAATAVVQQHGVGVKMALLHMYSRHMPPLELSRVDEYAASYRSKLSVCSPSEEEDGSPTACLQLRRLGDGDVGSMMVVPLSWVVQDVMVLPHFGETPDRFLVNRWLFNKG